MSQIVDSSIFTWWQQHLSGIECWQLLDTLGHLNDDYGDLVGNIKTYTFMVVFISQYLKELIDYSDENRSHEMQYGAVDVLFVVSMDKILASWLVDKNCIAVFQLQSSIQLKLQLQLILQLQFEFKFQFQFEFELQFIKLQNHRIVKYLISLVYYSFITIKVGVMLLLVMELNSKIFQEKT